MMCHIQGQGFGKKIYISESFTIVGYLHTAGFKNRRGINCAKCTWNVKLGYTYTKEEAWTVN